MSENILYSYWGLSNPKHAIQIKNGNYLVCDNIGITELDITLTDIIKAFTVSGIIFFDYSEENETLLTTNANSGLVSEITWSNVDYGKVLWEANYFLNSPQCATYKQGDTSKIVIADTNNNRIIKVDKTNGIYEPLYYYDVSGVGGLHEMSMFNKPQRVVQYSDGNICVVEKQGKVLDFSIVESSSSSSSSSGLYSDSSASSTAFSSCLAISGFTLYDGYNGNYTWLNGSWVNDSNSSLYIWAGDRVLHGSGVYPNCNYVGNYFPLGRYEYNIYEYGIVTKC